MNPHPYFHFPQPLIDRVIQDWPLGSQPESAHGPEHWQRVSRNAQYLLIHESTGEDQVARLLPYVRAFALFHDCQRVHEGWDTEHGSAASRYVKRVWWTQTHEQLSSEILYDALHVAMCRHTCLSPGNEDSSLAGWLYATDPGLLVRICLDADRLDLGRVGIVPDPKYLFTPAGRYCAAHPEAFAKVEAFVPEFSTV